MDSVIADGINNRSSRNTKSIKDIVSQMCKTDSLMEKSVLKPGIEQAFSVPTLRQSRLQLKKTKKAEREKTKGSKWYNLPMTEVTEEVKNDLSILQMRSALDPKHFYKANDLKVLPKYFQVGTVLDSSADFYDSVPKKMRKRTLVEELLSDAEFKRYNKKRYLAIQESQPKRSFHSRSTKGKKPKKKSN